MGSARAHGRVRRRRQLRLDAGGDAGRCTGARRAPPGARDRRRHRPRLPRHRHRPAAVGALLRGRVVPQHRAARGPTAHPRGGRRLLRGAGADRGADRHPARGGARLRRRDGPLLRGDPPRTLRRLRGAAHRPLHPLPADAGEGPLPDARAAGLVRHRPAWRSPCSPAGPGVSTACPASRPPTSPRPWPVAGCGVPR